MVKLSHIFRPASLEEVVGQPIELLKQAMQFPSQGCWMLVGPAGTGKTVTTRLVAERLGCVDDFSGLHHVPCTLLGIEEAKKLFLKDVAYVSSSAFHLVILEECEFLSPQVQRFLKDALDPETNMQKNLIVMGTSNNLDAIDDALLDRFRVLQYESNEEFANTCLNKIKDKWVQILKRQPPADYRKWGWKGKHFSMRYATKCAEDALQKELAQC